MGDSAGPPRSEPKLHVPEAAPLTSHVEFYPATALWFDDLSFSGSSDGDFDFGLHERKADLQEATDQELESESESDSESEPESESESVVNFKLKWEEVEKEMTAATLNKVL